MIADVAERRLYVSHEAHIDVVDLDGDSLITVLDSLPGVHGVAVDGAAHRVYTSNGGDSSVTVFDTRTLRTLTRLHLSKDAPDGIVFEPVSRRVFAMHGGVPALSVIDAGADTVLRSLELGGTPDGGVPDGAGKLFVALKDRSELLVLDARRLVIEERWPLAPCVRPDAIAFDAEHERIVLGCDSGTTILVDRRSGVVHMGFPIGPRVDGVSVLGNMIVASTADGVVTIATCHADQCAVRESVRTEAGSRTSALDERTRRLYVPYDRRLSAPGVSAATGGTTVAPPEGFGVLIISLPQKRPQRALRGR
ncbi:MAG: hypothetical protein ABI601_02925 [bacterium]